MLLIPINKFWYRRALMIAAYIVVTICIPNVNASHYYHHSNLWPTKCNHHSNKQSVGKYIIWTKTINYHTIDHYSNIWLITCGHHSNMQKLLVLPMWSCDLIHTYIPSKGETSFWYTVYNVIKFDTSLYFVILLIPWW